MKQCIKCLSRDLSPIVEANKIYYQCHNCHSIENRFVDVTGEIASDVINGNMTHVTVAAMVRKGDSILLVNRRNFPFGYCFPGGHLEHGEKPENAIDRELIEETGLKPSQKKLVFNEIIYDRCKSGANFHKWFLYEIETKGDLILNSEMDKAIWVKKEDLYKIELADPAKVVLNKIGWLGGNDSDYDNYLQPGDFVEEKNSAEKIENALVDNLPLAMILLDNSGKIEYYNRSALGLIESFKAKSDLVKFNQSVKVLAQNSLKSKHDASKMLMISGKRYSLSARLLIVHRKIKGISVAVNNISLDHKQEVKDIIAYQSSIALSSNLSSTKIINTILKQLMVSFQITGCNLMILDDDGWLKTSSRFERNSNRNIPKKTFRKFKIGEGIAGLVAKSLVPFATPDSLKEPEFIKAKSKQSYSLLSVPVISNNKVWGVLNVKREKGLYFSEEETNMVLIVANRIGLALEQDNLYKSLEAKNNTLNKVLDTASDGLMLIDKNYNILFHNEAIEKMLVLDRASIESRSLKPFLEKRDSGNSRRFIDAFKKAIVNKKPVSLEHCSVTYQGQCFRLNLNPIIQKNGSCTRVLVGIDDITQIKKEQSKVKTQVKQLTALFRISSLSKINNFEYFPRVLNKAAEMLDSETVGLYFFKKNSYPMLQNLSDPETVEFISKNKLPLNYLNNSIKAGKHNIKRLLLSPITTIGGEVIGIIYIKNKSEKYTKEDEKFLHIVASTISSRLDALKLIDQSKNDQEQIRRIINNTGDGIIVVDVRVGRVVVWNKAMERITGFKNLDEYRDANTDAQGRVDDIVEQLGDNRADHDTYREFKIINSEGQNQWLGARYSCMHEEDKPVYLIIVLRDISREKFIEDRNKEFIYTTTHELRTPLTAIKGYLSMILNGDAGPVKKKQGEYFLKAYHATERLVKLVEDILKTARLEEDRITFNIEPFDAHLLAEEIVSDFTQKAHSKGLRLSIINGQNFKIKGDPYLTRQALSNVLDNAIKYTAKGEVSLRLSKSGKFGNISIVDSGVGIPKKDLSTIFDKFYRVPNSESVKAGGTGLGLFIVKNLIEKQNGKINIESTLGKGSIMTISLPLEKETR